MRSISWLTSLGSRLRPSRRTVRFRLTLLYGGLFLLAGAGLLAITYLLADHLWGMFGMIVIKDESAQAHGTKRVLHNGHLAAGLYRAAHLTPQQRHRVEQLKATALRQHVADLHMLLIVSGIALAVMAILAIWLGWLVAGRVLRPLRTMTGTAQQISEHNLHERLALQGPDDELKGLADTLDGLLGRVETAFVAQRRFVANASHELRTPVTLQRALLEVALANPDASTDALRAACERAIAASEHHEHLIESLLTLATSERGLEKREPFDLSVVVEHVLLVPHPAIERRGLHVGTALSPAPATGDPRLIERLVSNLVANALNYNVDHGDVHIATGTTAGRVFLSVSNTGPVIPANEVDRLFQPFQRLEPKRTGPDGGVGLGLSIVHAIATAHDATLTASARPGGGLEVTVHFPTSSPPGRIKVHPHHGNRPFTNRSPAAHSVAQAD